MDNPALQQCISRGAGQKEFGRGIPLPSLFRYARDRCWDSDGLVMCRRQALRELNCRVEGCLNLYNCNSGATLTPLACQLEMAFHSESASYQVSGHARRMIPPRKSKQDPRGAPTMYNCLVTGREASPCPHHTTSDLEMYNKERGCTQPEGHSVLKHAPHNDIGLIRVSAQAAKQEGSDNIPQICMSQPRAFRSKERIPLVSSDTTAFKLYSCTHVPHKPACPRAHSRSHTTAFKGKDADLG